MKRWKASVAIALPAFALGACAVMPAHDAELDDARAAVIAAQSDPQVVSLAPQAQAEASRADALSAQARAAAATATAQAARAQAEAAQQQAANAQAHAQSLQAALAD